MATQLVGAARGSQALLECLVEGWPHPLTSWIRQDQSLILSNHKYHLVEEKDGGYRTRMRLKVTDVSEKDFGSFKCVARNTLGEKEGFIRLYGQSFLSSSSHPLPELFLSPVAPNAETKVVREVEVVSSDKHTDHSVRATDEMDAQNRVKGSSNFSLRVKPWIQRTKPSSPYLLINASSRRNAAAVTTAGHWTRFTRSSHTIATSILVLLPHTFLSRTIV